MINRVSDCEERAARTAFDNTATTIRSKLNLSEIDGYARQNPVVVLVIGAAMGLALGWWVKRK